MSITTLPSATSPDSDPAAIATPSSSQPSPPPSMQPSVSSTGNPFPSASQKQPVQPGDSGRTERSHNAGLMEEIKLFDPRPARADPRRYEMIMDALDKAIDGAEKALKAIDEEIKGGWLLNDEQKEQLRRAFGDFIFHPKNLSLLRESVVKTIDGLNYLRSNEKNGNSVIFLGDMTRHPDPRYKDYHSIIFASKDTVGSGIIIENKDNIKYIGVDSYRNILPYQYIYDASRLSIGLHGDVWTDIDKPVGKTTEDALKNAPSVTYGIKVFNDAIDKSFGLRFGLRGEPTGFRNASDARSASWATQGQFFQYGKPVNKNPHQRAYTFPDGSRVVARAHEPLLTNSDGSNFAQFLTTTGSTAGGALAGGAAGFFTAGPPGALVGGMAGAGAGMGAGLAAAQSYPYDRIWQGYTLEYYKKDMSQPFSTQYMYAWDSDPQRVKAFSEIKDPATWPDYAGFSPDENWDWWTWKSGNVPLRT